MKNPGINFDEPFGRNLSRLTGAYIRETLKQLAAIPSDESNVHKARLLFKRLRSLVRMSRFGLGKPETKRLDHFFRDQGRKLSRIRDAEVVARMLKPMIKNIERGEERTLLIRFRARLMDQRRKLQGKDNALEARKEVIHHLTILQKEIPLWEPKEEPSAIFLTGAKATYLGCKSRFKGLKKAQDDNALHAWRKQVKYLWYQMELLLELWPSRFSAWVSDLKELSQALGMHHDLVLLEMALKAFVASDLEKMFPETLEKINEEKTRIASGAISLGNKIFSVKASCFYRQLNACLQEAGKQD
ncbi:MAG: CHAD domain-containing protein [Bacteroides sp.]|nr:CHAD domain-containing protein [Bacteroides sp.]